MEVTGTLSAYVSPHSSVSPKDLQKPSCLQGLAFWDQGSKYPLQNGYTLVGTAVITLTLASQDVIVANKIDALRNEAKGIRADATAKCTRIESQIQQLLCIENGATASINTLADDDLPF